MDIIVPELGEGIMKAVVACWHFKEGEEVKKDYDIVELVTDKASFNISSPVQGIIQGINYKEGEEVSIGSIIACIV